MGWARRWGGCNALLRHDDGTFAPAQGDSATGAARLGHLCVRSSSAAKRFCGRANGFRGCVNGFPRGDGRVFLAWKGVPTPRATTFVGRRGDLRVVQQFFGLGAKWFLPAQTRFLRGELASFADRRGGSRSRQLDFAPDARRFGSRARHFATGARGFWVASGTSGHVWRRYTRVQARRTLVQAAVHPFRPRCARVRLKAIRERRLGVWCRRRHTATRSVTTQ